MLAAILTVLIWWLLDENSRPTMNLPGYREYQD
jgi:hypothetical protein